MLLISECALFDPVITDRGICHSYNAQPSVTMMNPSYFRQSFTEAYENDLTHNWTLSLGSGAGEGNALNFYLLDKDGLLGRNGSKEYQFSYFVGFSSKEEYFDMKSNGQRIKPGYHTIWKVHAMEIESSEDLRSVPIGKIILQSTIAFKLT